MDMSKDVPRSMTPLADTPAIDQEHGKQMLYSCMSDLSQLLTDEQKHEELQRSFQCFKDEHDKLKDRIAAHAQLSQTDEGKGAADTQTLEHENESLAVDEGPDGADDTHAAQTGGLLASFGLSRLTSALRWALGYRDEDEERGQDELEEKGRDMPPMSKKALKKQRQRQRRHAEQSQSTPALAPLSSNEVEAFEDAVERLESLPNLEDRQPGGQDTPASEATLVGQLDFDEAMKQAKEESETDSGWMVATRKRGGRGQRGAREK